jgi:hypothetical protein
LKKPDKDIKENEAHISTKGPNNINNSTKTKFFTHPLINSKSIGCYKDRGFELQVLNTIDLYRDLEYFALDSNDIKITIETCVHICFINSYKYAGLQYS